MSLTSTAVHFKGNHMINIGLEKEITVSATVELIRGLFERLAIAGCPSQYLILYGDTPISLGDERFLFSLAQGQPIDIVCDD